MSIRVLVVDDHAVFAQLFVDALRRIGYECIAGDPTALDDDALVALAAESQASIVVLDLVLGRDRSGLPLIERFVAGGSRVVVLTADDDPDMHARAISGGAAAALDKLRPLEQVLTALGALAPLDHADGSTGLASLTRREQEVLVGLVAGRSAKDIATGLGVAVPTVRTQIRAVYRKLGVNNQRAAILAAVRGGWDIDNGPD